MKSFAMMVLGCKVNDYEATYVREKMLEKGYEEVPFKQKADIYLIFTCCVTNTAESKTRKYLHRARKQNQEAYTVAVGCLVQIKHDEKEVFEDIDLIIGSSRKDKIVDYIEEEKKCVVVEEVVPTDFEDLLIESYPGKSRAFLKIQDGCNQFCSYCIIPYARGRERSADHNTVLKEAEKLSESVRELVLTGIHTGRYYDGEYHLYDLLKALSGIDNIKTIRLSSIEMNEIGDDILSLFSEGKLAPHLHIPVQALSDKILKAMHRPYTMEEYKKRIFEIREKVPGISISTDLIVGFPGEDEETFEKSLKELEEIRFSFIHVFPYARKSGTAADKMEGHLRGDVKKERVARIMKEEKKYTEEYRRSFLGKNINVLIEKSEDGFSCGYSREYLYTKVRGIYPIGEILEVKARSVEDDMIIGEYAAE